MLKENQALEVLKNRFGFNSFKEGQEEVVNNLLNGHSVAAIFPTAGGKSICYQLPALMLPHTTLVVSPLLALMEDQILSLKSKGISAASINSQQTWDEQKQVKDGVYEGKIKILMVSVERFENEAFRRFIRKIKISLLAVDEAHCLSEWGHNFRPNYLMIPKYKEEFNIPQTLLLTATATPSVVEDMQKTFDIKKEHTTLTGFYRNNLDLNICPVAGDKKNQALIDLVSSNKNASTIVYVMFQKTAEEIAGILSSAGISAEFFHADIKPAQKKKEIQQQFMSGKIKCIVATIAFGMGIDKPDIRQVIHYNLPKSIESYSQEVGRAGRDGLKSTCTMIASESCVTALENFVYGVTPEKKSIRILIDQIYSAQGSWEVELTSLGNDANMRQIALKTFLVYLAREDIISPKNKYNKVYRFVFIKTEQQILALLEAESYGVAKAVFNCSPKGRSWHTVSFSDLFENFKIDGKTVRKILGYFELNGWIELKAEKAVNVYNINNTSKNTNELVDYIYDLFHLKEVADIKRIQTMLDFFKTNSCINKSLSSHFADNKAPTRCEHCSSCLGNHAKFPPIKRTTVDKKYFSMCVSQNCTQRLLNWPSMNLEVLSLVLRNISY